MHSEGAHAKGRADGTAAVHVCGVGSRRGTHATIEVAGCFDF